MRALVAIPVVLLGLGCHGTCRVPKCLRPGESVPVKRDQAALPADPAPPRCERPAPRCEVEAPKTQVIKVPPPQVEIRMPPETCVQVPAPPPAAPQAVAPAHAVPQGVPGAYPQALPLMMPMATATVQAAPPAAVPALGLHWIRIPFPVLRLYAVPAPPQVTVQVPQAQMLAAPQAVYAAPAAAPQAVYPAAVAAPQAVAPPTAVCPPGTVHACVPVQTPASQATPSGVPPMTREQALKEMEDLTKRMQSIKDQLQPPCDKK
jgi:hypothetical protein